jgi:hypothetical protein
VSDSEKGRKAVPASITYRLAYGPHPWPGEKHKGMSAWAIWRQVWQEPQPTLVCEEPVAIFNLDSAGDAFGRFLCAGGLLGFDQ